VRRFVEVVVFLTGYKLQVLCFDIRGHVYKFDNIWRADEMRYLSHDSALRLRGRSISMASLFPTRRARRSEPSGVWKLDRKGKALNIPPFLEYQVEGQSLPDLPGCFGVEMICFVGALLR
jgi:hypothetical protein